MKLFKKRHKAAQENSNAAAGENQPMYLIIETQDGEERKGFAVRMTEKDVERQLKWEEFLKQSEEREKQHEEFERLHQICMECSDIFVHCVGDELKKKWAEEDKIKNKN